MRAKNHIANKSRRRRARRAAGLARAIACASFAALLAGSAPTLLAGGGHDEHEHGDHEHDEHGHGEEEHSDEVTLAPEAVRLANFTLEKATRRALTATATVPARVAYNAEAMAHIGTQAQGRASEIAVRLGDEARAGDLLVVVESPDLGMAMSEFLQKDAGVDAARIGFEAAEILVEVARTAFERAETLRESNGISITEFLERQGSLRQAEAAARRAQADLRVAQSARLAAENQLHIYGVSQAGVEKLLETGEVSTRYEIRAPISGRVVEREVTPGEVVDPGEEALMILANMEELWVLADVPERLASRVAIGAPARVTVGALQGVSFDGTVSYVAPHLDARTRAATVRIALAASSRANVAGNASPAANATGARMDHGHGHGHDEHGHDERAEEKDHDHDHDHDHGSGDDNDDAGPARSESAPALDAGHALKPGMFGEAELTLSPIAGDSGAMAIVVPMEVRAAANLPIDAVPDITNNQVQINTRPSLSPPRSRSRSPTRSRTRWPASRAWSTRARSRATASRRSRRSSGRTSTSTSRAAGGRASDRVRARCRRARVPHAWGPISTGLGEVYMYTVEYEHPDGTGARVRRRRSRAGSTTAAT
jgi:multidrug resistance efflux pump